MRTNDAPPKAIGDLDRTQLALYAAALQAAALALDAARYAIRYYANALDGYESAQSADADLRLKRPLPADIES